MADPIFAAAGTTPQATRWQDATVVAILDETARAKTFRLALSHPVRHMAGQHYVVRLTAPDGYRAQRSYSAASAPADDGHVDLTVERLDGGEVSSFLHDVVEVGDELTVRGPIGGFFVSVRTPAELLYRAELAGAEVTVVHSRATGPDGRPAGRLTAADLPAIAGAATGYVCGSAGFADHAGRLLLAAGLPADRIKVERFGPTA